MVEDPLLACAGADIVLIGNESGEHYEALKLLKPEQTVLDLTPARRGVETPARYERISS
jgi:hypothetical protein